MTALITYKIFDRLYILKACKKPTVLINWLHVDGFYKHFNNKNTIMFDKIVLSEYVFKTIVLKIIKFTYNFRHKLWNFEYNFGLLSLKIIILGGE